MKRIYKQDVHDGAAVLVFAFDNEFDDMVHMTKLIEMGLDDND